MTLRPADTQFVESLAAVLPADTLRDVEPRYLEEPRGRYRGQGGAVALPRSTEEVSCIVKACDKAGVGLIPLGGGTGLVGGQVMTTGPAPLLLSLERMTSIRTVSAEANVIVAEAGCTVSDLHQAAEAENRLYPLSLASEGTARVGGTLATNAGGVNVLRYGNARDLCLGLEAVLPNGEVWNGLTRLRKDNTGYDLRNLMIGSEGSLGVITAASLKLFARPQRYETAILDVPSVEAALELLALVRDAVGESVSAFELMHKQSFLFLRETYPDVRLPFEHDPDWAVLVDLGLSKAFEGQAPLESIFETAFEQGLVTDGMVAQSESQRDAFWTVRETIPAANKVIGSISSHDVSVPIERISEFLPEGRKAVAQFGDLRVNCFGHLGDGNLHFNVFPPDGCARSDYENVRHEVMRAVHDVVMDFEGSFSAEHGVGRLKVEDLERYGDPAGLAAMHAIKAALDPKGIMNPGAVLRQM